MTSLSRPEPHPLKEDSVFQPNALMEDFKEYLEEALEQDEIVKLIEAKRNKLAPIQIFDKILCDYLVDRVRLKFHDEFTGKSSGHFFTDLLNEILESDFPPRLQVVRSTLSDDMGASESDWEDEWLTNEDFAVELAWQEPIYAFLEQVTSLEKETSDRIALMRKTP